MPAIAPPFDPVLVANLPPAAVNALLSSMVFDLVVPVNFNTADATVLWTVPGAATGANATRLAIIDAGWEVTTTFAGGASSTIGISSSNSNYNTKGDILGAAAGDAAAVLTAGGKILVGAAGTKISAGNRVVLVGGDTIRFDRITSAFTSGVGLLHFRYQILPTS